VTDQPQFDAAAFWQEPDFLLNDLVSLFANALDAELGVTLLVGGAVVSGMLVGERAYLQAVNGLVRRLARELADKPTQAEMDELMHVFSPDRLSEDVLAAVMDGEGPEAATAVELETDLLDNPPPLRYLHLRDPILIQPGAMLHFGDSELPIMRLRMSQVEGWIIGRASLISADSIEDAFPPGGMVH
jgi:hypothetical protein